MESFMTFMKENITVGDIITIYIAVGSAIWSLCSAISARKSAKKAQKYNEAGETYFKKATEKMEKEDLEKAQLKYIEELRKKNPYGSYRERGY
ncbi:MAG: hypothetical protein LBM38_01015 [Clostridiales bacterium]|jgi:outer membrane protein assembly factor BamD (BamD/ComL family)|nr:hypothetical protein [Clostridiales bacterium]